MSITNDELIALKNAAKAAGCESWTIKIHTSERPVPDDNDDWTIYTSSGTPIVNEQEWQAHRNGGNLAAFIALANPDTILRLIECVASARADGLYVAESRDGVFVKAWPLSDEAALSVALK